MERTQPAVLTLTMEWESSEPRNAGSLQKLERKIQDSRIQGSRLSSRISRKERSPASTLILAQGDPVRLLISKTTREYVCIVLSHYIYGCLLEQQQETNPLTTEFDSFLRTLPASIPSLNLCSELEVNIIVSIKQINRWVSWDSGRLTSSMKVTQSWLRAELPFAEQALALPCNRHSGEASLLPQSALQVAEEALLEWPLP